MTLGRTLAHRFLHVAKACGSHLRSKPLPPEPERFLDRIRILNPNRIRLDCLDPNPIADPNAITVAEVKKVLRAAEMEAARARLRDVEMSNMSYKEFLRICCEASSTGQGSSIAKLLDESGSVIVFGDRVFLRPDQLAKMMGGLMYPPTMQQFSRNEELRAMEAKKALIDKEAEAAVKKELWCGLGFMVVQTMGFMRLTFWELSWDVMEPICFFVTSTYFMTGYGFFLKTSKEPSFEGFYQRRFAVKQRKLMKLYNFDLDKFIELKNASRTMPIKASSSGMQLGIVH